MSDKKKTRNNYSDQDKQNILSIVCDQMASGKSVRAIFRDEELKETLPSRSKFREWIDKNEDFRAQYMRACEEREEYIFDDILSIADETTNDHSIVEISEGVEVSRVNNEAIQRSRLRIDARKWHLSKVNPKKYGDKIEIDQKVTDERLTDEELKEYDDFVKKIKEGK